MKKIANQKNSLRPLNETNKITVNENEDPEAVT